ncbi:hypothetical protein [Streptomyces sp. NPDC005303]|uniref:hypothetical protein n=1 Tax=Streptomyces sp. NPDC005303 TaxID=3155713 RepID=UPI0033BBF2EF
MRERPRGGPHDGRLLAGLLGEVDTFEVEQMSEREMRQRVEGGLPSTGPRCFGYTADGAELIGSQLPGLSRSSLLQDQRLLPGPVKGSAVVRAEMLPLLAGESFTKDEVPLGGESALSKRL